MHTEQDNQVQGFKSRSEVLNTVLRIIETGQNNEGTKLTDKSCAYVFTDPYADPDDDGKFLNESCIIGCLMPEKVRFAIKDATFNTAGIDVILEKEVFNIEYFGGLSSDELRNMQTIFDDNTHVSHNFVKENHLQYYFKKNLNGCYTSEYNRLELLKAYVQVLINKL